MQIKTKSLLKITIFTIIYMIMAVIFPLQQSVITITFMIGVAITGILFALLFFILSFYLETMGRSHIFLLWLPLFIIQFFNPILEGYLFTTAISGMDQLIGAFIFGAIISLVYAVTGAYLFPAAGAEISIRSSLNKFFGSRTKRQNILRFLIASLSWALIYFIFGSIVGPFVLPYYTDPSSGYNLILPDVATLLLIQIFRGFVYVLSVLPLLASLRLDFRMLSFILMAFLYIGGGIAIFVIIDTFPLFLRIVHGVEIFADSLVFGIVIAYLLGSKSE